MQPIREKQRQGFLSLVFYLNSGALRRYRLQMQVEAYFSDIGGWEMPFSTRLYLPRYYQVTSFSFFFFYTQATLALRFPIRQLSLLNKISASSILADNSTRSCVAHAVRKCLVCSGSPVSSRRQANLQHRRQQWIRPMQSTNFSLRGIMRGVGAFVVVVVGKEVGVFGGWA